jgi:hypothetical protein
MKKEKLAYMVILLFLAAVVSCFNTVFWLVFDFCLNHSSIFHFLF